MLSEYLRFILVWLCVNKIHGFSFRSSTNVRGAAAILEYNGGDTPTWLQDLTARIERLVSRHGLEGARPYIEKAVRNAELKRSVLLNVKVKRNGESKVRYQLKSILRAYPEDNEEDKDTLKEMEPEWLSNLRSYVIKVISQYGRKDLDIHLRPVITSLQEKHDVTVTDIDADKFGNVIIKYIKGRSKAKEVGRLQFVST